MEIVIKVLRLICLTLLLSSCNNVQKTYYESGQLKSRAQFKDGLKNGTCENFYESSRLSSIFYYEAGVRNGEYKLYYENGILETEGCFLNDTLNGFAIEYYENGDTILNTRYVNGIAVLDIRYKNGRRFRIIDYCNEIMVVFDENGNVEKRFEIERPLFITHKHCQ